MATIAPLAEVVVSDLAMQVQQILENPMPFDIQEQLGVLHVLQASRGDLSDKKQHLAGYLTKGINQDHQSQQVIELSYKVAREVFGSLLPEVGETIGFISERENVSIFSDQPVRHAVILDKEEILYYHLNKEDLSLADIQESLTEYICTHTAEEGAKMLQALCGKNPVLLNEFLQTQMTAFKGYLSASKEAYEQSIDQFLSLIKFNKAYQMFYGQREDLQLIAPLDEAKYVMQIAHGVPLKLMISQTAKVKEYHRKISEIKDLRGDHKSQLLRLKNELEIFLERLKIAKDFLKNYSYLEKDIACSPVLKGKSEMLFEMNNDEYKTHLGFLMTLIGLIDERLKMPPTQSKRLASEELQSPPKRVEAAVVPRSSYWSSCVIS